MIKAIIFDLDGVLSDTQHLHTKVEKKILAEHGISISEKELTRLYAGTKDGTGIRKEFEKRGLPFDLQSLLREKYKRMLTEKSTIAPVPGVIVLVDTLHKTYPLAVASGSAIGFIKLVLRKLTIARKFTVLVSANEVAEGKPDPAIFLLAAKKLGVDPKECLVIEDAPNGVAAAKKAGMKCIAITTTHAEEDLKKADKIIHSFDEFTIAMLEQP